MTIEVSALPADYLLEGVLAEPVEGALLREYRRTDHTLRIRWSSDTKVVMGTIKQFERGAVLRGMGTLRPSDEVEAEVIAVLTKVVTIHDADGQ